jgi:hypothetical protein
MNQSNKIYTELVPTYSDFKPLNKGSFTGYKLVQTSGGNYYSIVSGMFRYRPKRVSQNSYHSIYQNENTYNPELVDKVAIFQDKQEAYDALINYVNEHNGELVIIEVQLKGELIIGKYTNQYCKDAIVVAGQIIESVTEIK